jgi:hypothetical protein
LKKKFLRGRPPKADWSKKLNDYREFQRHLNDVWPQAGEQLLRAQTPADIDTALRSLTWAANPVPMWPTIDAIVYRVPDILCAIKSKKFPKQDAARIRFIAKFLACGSNVSVRTLDRHRLLDMTSTDNSHSLIMFEV